MTETAAYRLRFACAGNFAICKAQARPVDFSRVFAERLIAALIAELLGERTTPS